MMDNVLIQQGPMWILFFCMRKVGPGIRLEDSSIFKCFSQKNIAICSGK